MSLWLQAVGPRHPDLLVYASTNAHVDRDDSVLNLSKSLAINYIVKHMFH